MAQRKWKFITCQLLVACIFIGLREADTSTRTAERRDWSSVANVAKTCWCEGSTWKCNTRAPVLAHICIHTHTYIYACALGMWASLRVCQAGKILTYSVIWEIKETDRSCGKWICSNVDQLKGCDFSSVCHCCHANICRHARLSSTQLNWLLSTAVVHCCGALFLSWSLMRIQGQHILSQRIGNSRTWKLNFEAYFQAFTAHVQMIMLSNMKLYLILASNDDRFAPFQFVLLFQVNF